MQSGRKCNSRWKATTNATFFEAFAKHLQLPNIQIRTFDGKDRLREFLETLAGVTAFQTVKRVGIIRDADESADAAPAERSRRRGA